MRSPPASGLRCWLTSGSASENAEFGALERRWNIVGGDGMTVRLPLVVGFAKAMELIITGRRIDVHEAYRIGLVNEVVPCGQALVRAQELAHQIRRTTVRSDPQRQGECHARRGPDTRRAPADRAEQIVSMFCAVIRTRSERGAFKAGNLTPEWPHHGL
jgi:enoyl-CoA hydratase/carnithine racemase